LYNHATGAGGVKIAVLRKGRTNKRHLNALVNLRNNIAHGSFPSTMDYDIFNEHAKSAIGLMESFENIVIHNLNIRNFCS
jgi:hypothetical protein